MLLCQVFHFPKVYNYPLATCAIIGLSWKLYSIWVRALTVPISPEEALITRKTKKRYISSWGNISHRRISIKPVQMNRADNQCKPSVETAWMHVQVWVCLLNGATGPVFVTMAAPLHNRKPMQKYRTNLCHVDMSWLRLHVGAFHWRRSAWGTHLAVLN